MAQTQSPPRPPHLQLSNNDLLGDHEGWTRSSTIYQDSMGQCTLQAAHHIVQRTHALLPFSAPPVSVLDNGCGGGSLVRAVKAAFPAAPVLATDIAAGMLARLDAACIPGVAVQREDATLLAGLADAAFSHVLSSCMVQFTSHPAATLVQMRRVLRPGGVAAVAIWGPRLDLAIVHDKACRAVMPGYVLQACLAEGSWDTEEEHVRRMEAVGFVGVQAETIEARFPVASASEYVAYWFGSGNPVNETMIKNYRDQGGDLEACKEAMERIVRDEYADGQGLVMEVVVGWGRK